MPIASMLVTHLLTDSAVTIGAIAAIMTGFGVIWLKAVRPSWRKFRAAYHLVQRVTHAADRLLPFAEQQLRSNGGSSLKDQIDRIDALTLGNHKSAEEHWRKLGDRLNAVAALQQEQHTEVTARLDRIEGNTSPPIHVVVDEESGGS